MTAAQIQALLDESPCVANLKSGELAWLIVTLLFNITQTGIVTVQQVYDNAGDPNGVVLHNSTLPAMCIDTLNHIVWVKVDHIASNTGWGAP